MCVALRELVARRANHYTEAEVTEILAAAEAAGLHVIPLVQCFGHLEWLLKHAAQDDGAILPIALRRVVRLRQILFGPHA